MADIPRASAIRGTAMRWAWTEGPTRGQVYEHIFHDDVVLNFATHDLVGFASGREHWYPVRGTFEIVG